MMPDKFVCADCFDEYAIQDFIREHASSHTCSYCHKESKRLIAANFEDVMELISEGIEFEWNNPGNELPYESREGGYQGDTIDTYDLLEELELGIELDELRNDIVSFFDNSLWCKRDYFRLEEGKALFSSWERFSKIIKRQTRYLFFEDMDLPDYDDLLHPAAVLEHIGLHINQVGIETQLPAGTSVFRARPHKEAEKEKVFDTAKELGPPLKEQAIYSNRMSPAGIPMFYGAIDEQTALSEVWEKPNESFTTVAEFKTIKELAVLDFSKLRQIPSEFDREKRRLRPTHRFLNAFIADLSKPIVKDGREHIEYCPTQVVTEYFRHKFQGRSSRINGILYQSSKNEEGTCCVLFCEQSNCLDAPPPGCETYDQWLKITKNIKRLKCC